MVDYIENYKALAGAIVEEQCRHYYESYIRAYRNRGSNKQYYIRRLAWLRSNIENGWAQYLNIDIDVILNEIEKKARNHEDIIWKQNSSGKPRVSHN